MNSLNLDQLFTNAIIAVAVITVYLNVTGWEAGASSYFISLQSFK